MLRQSAPLRRANEATLVMAEHLKELGIDFVQEHPFSQRRWRFDFAFTCKRRNTRGEQVAIEIEGGVFSQGRHSRGKGFTEDCIKYNHAEALGWVVFRFTTEQVLKGEAREFLKQWLEGRL